MTIDDVRLLFDYHYWARDRMLAAVEPLSAEQMTRNMGNSFSSIRDTLAHLHAAEWVWYSRWQGTSPTSLLAADRFPDFAALRAAWSALERDVRAFVEALGPDGIDREIDYKLLSGQPGRSTYGQMAQHVVNHGTYHRGQITTMLRQLGAPPPKITDMIAFYREMTAPR